MHVTNCTSITPVSDIVGLADDSRVLHCFTFVTSNCFFRGEIPGAQQMDAKDDPWDLGVVLRERLHALDSWVAWMNLVAPVCPMGRSHSCQCSPEKNCLGNFQGTFLSLMQPKPWSKRMCRRDLHL